MESPTSKEVAAPRAPVALTRPNFEARPNNSPLPEKTEGNGGGGHGGGGGEIRLANQTHDHARWRLIAEEFSSLLDEPYIDVVFKVRGGNGLLAAHRTLVAAAWPVLREDLRSLESRPARELRAMGLTWIDPAHPDSPKVAAGAESEQGVNMTNVSTLIAGQGTGMSIARVLPAQGSSPAEGVPGRSSPFAAQGSSPAEEARDFGSDAREAWPRPQSPDAWQEKEKLPGIVDVTSRPWGSYSIMRALLCHMYGRPVEIRERELQQVRQAAQAFGISELVRSCDEVERRPGPMSRVMASGSNQVGNGSGGQSQLRAEEPSTAPAQHPDRDKPPTATSSTSFAATSTDGKSTPHRILSSDGISTNTSFQDTRASASVVPEDPGGQSDAAGPGPVRVISRPPKEVQAGASRNIGGVRSNPSNENEDPPPSHAKSVSVEQGPGCVRRVLSEIKRNIAESSRIIADKTFQQMYEMVPGERGILGEGINGPVRMARHRKTNREVAVKRIQCMNLTEQRRQMLVSEIRIFLQVSHRNIVQLLEVYESEVDTAVLLVMELCTGKELFERLADRRWYSEFDAARVTRQMLDAVSYLHSQNICHRDLKLENWLYENPSQEAKLKLCDFGFGQIVEPSVQLTATLGSLFYLAPEVLEGSYGLPCDMWSIGVIVYMLIAGVPPFDGKTDADVMSKIRQGRFVSTGKRWEGISEPAKHFVRSLLRKDPYERLTAAEAAQHAWLKMESQPKALSNLHGRNLEGELELPIDRGVIRDMWKFAQNNAITRAALGMLAKWNTGSSFSGREEDVLTLENSFRALDEQNTGKIEAEAFIRVLRETMQISDTEEKLFFERIAGNVALTEMDGDEDAANMLNQKRRFVNYCDFITLTKARRHANNTHAILQAFRTFDESGEGFIGEADMHSILGDEFKATIEDYVDLNGKDLIDYVDFANIVSKEMAKKEEDESVAKMADQSIERRQSIESEKALKGDKVLKSVPPPVLERRNSVSSDSSKQAVPVVEEGTAEATNVPPAGDNSTRQTSDTETSPNNDAAPAPGNVPAVVPREPGAEEEQPEEGDKNEKEGDEEEEYDADAQSDEEQLVNVKREPTEASKPTETTSVSERKGNGDTSEVGNKDTESQAKPKPIEQKKPDKSKDSRFQSFSLSLAGSSEYDDTPWGVNRVMSMPSDVYSIRQMPGFHTKVLRPFYASRPVSNIVMGLIRGTSLYAKQSVVAKLATIIHTTWGWFFIMPNPKYHTEVDTRKGLLSKETGKFRFVAWWIHPRFVPQLRQWFEKLTNEGDKELANERREARQRRKESDAAAAAASGADSKKPDWRSSGDESRIGTNATDLQRSLIQPATDGAATVAADVKFEEPHHGSPAAASQETRMPTTAETKPLTLPLPVLSSADKITPPDQGRGAPSPPPSTRAEARALNPGDKVQAPTLHPGEKAEAQDQAKQGQKVFAEGRGGIGGLPGSAVNLEQIAKDSMAKQAAQKEDLGGPGDFRFSDVPKPENYLHSFRDMHSKEHVSMIQQAHEGTHRFLKSLFDDNFLAKATISMGFHYPVRTQYATLHMQVRVNSGSVCRDDGRGIETTALIEQMKRDREAYMRDEQHIRYHVTENIKVSLLAAAHEYEEQHPGKDSVWRQSTPLSFELGAAAMPTIQDHEDEDDEAADKKVQAAAVPRSLSSRPRDEVASYLINLQPTPGSEFHKFLYEQRQKVKQEHLADSSSLYPFHVSVTGFFEAAKTDIMQLVDMMMEDLSTELAVSARITVGNVVCTETGYVLYDMNAPAIASFAQRLGERAQRELGMQVRPKAVNHISLASDRREEVLRESIKTYFSPDTSEEGDRRRYVLRSATFDLVLSRVVNKSNWAKFDEDGPHRFAEVARLPVRQGGDVRRNTKVCQDLIKEGVEGGSDSSWPSTPKAPPLSEIDAISHAISHERSLSAPASLSMP